MVLLKKFFSAAFVFSIVVIFMAVCLKTCEYEMTQNEEQNREWAKTGAY